MLAERPAEASGRAAVLVNGLGATKYEELFALFGDVAELLEKADVELVGPEVGELVTSLDMAGCSLSVTWLDEELERLWLAPADTPAFRRGNAEVSERFTTRRTAHGQRSPTSVAVEASEESIAAAAVPAGPWPRCTAAVEEHKEHLGRIDAIAGDGDHGIGMSRGVEGRRGGRRARPRAACRRCWPRPGPRSGTRPAGPAASSGGCCSTASARASATPTR